MRWRLILALFLMTSAIGPVSAQNDRGELRTETQQRIASRESSVDLLWNLVGLLGLIGLIGLLPQHEEDSYHPSSFDE
ncbi:hypothetical protein GCM10022276_03370 [Sphingomonas limnosediminicola]|jgi:hypothetical protein|uniref:Uncharacterized protein n=1 Tax=Sphingomonas limnosediminicola TaxID=940133 RepID=A0ABP7KTM0_9SPHN